MRTILNLSLTTVLILGVASPIRAGGTEAQGALDKLKSLEGSWRGTPHFEGLETEEAAEHMGEVVHEFRVSAAGTVVMETMGPGTDHEMINMYHIDGDDLVLTHYCAAGNQPMMRLDRKNSTANKLVFDFSGGTNLDPAVDEHIHSAKITIDGDHVKSVWSSQAKGQEAGVMTYHLARSK